MVKRSVDATLERLTGRVCVVGSINADLVVRVERLPRPGETLAGAPLWVNSGGKSANQAAAAARLGAHVDLVGAVGTDPWADVVTGALGDAGVRLDALRRLTGSATGTAVITVDAVGENSIVISAGANGDLAPADIEAVRDMIGAAGVLGLAFEVPPATVSAAALVAREAGVPVVLNPSPYRPPEPELLSLVDVLVVNEHEVVELLGGPVRRRVHGRAPRRCRLRGRASRRGGPGVCRQRPRGDPRGGPSLVPRPRGSRGLRARARRAPLSHRGIRQCGRKR